MDKKQTHKLTLKIQRFDPDTGRAWIQAYQLEAGRILRFVDLFRKLNDTQDPTLAWSSSCEHSQCGTCSVIINGKPLLACELLVENAVHQFKTTTFKIKPLNIAPICLSLFLSAVVLPSQQPFSLVRSRPFFLTASIGEDGGGRSRLHSLR